MKGKLARTLLVVLLLVALFAGFMLSKTMPNTELAKGFSLGAFQGIRAGEPESAVIQALGPPLARFSDEGPEEWCFGDATRTSRAESSWLDRLRSRPAEANCVYLIHGVVQDVRRGADEAIDALKGKTADEVQSALGKPSYVVPEGKKVRLRYSAPKEPTDAYEVFLVVLDQGGTVRGTQRYFYRD
jgi:outer membrane protein assembly factor BamE (lipoprotein component of BamABCDE complex)